MIYGLIGASGSGKSTLAQLVAEHMALTFLPTSISESAKRHGFEAVGDLSLHDRIDLQYHLLNDMVEAIRKVDRPAILDRTPIDMIAYMLCEVNMHSHKQVSDKDLIRIEDYVDECIDATQMHFAHVFFLNKLDFVAVGDKPRPPVNPAYAVHTDLVMRGALAMMEGMINMSIVEPTDLNVRLDHLSTIIANNLDFHERSRKQAALH